MNRIILAIALLALPVLSACNTVDGMGQDIKSTGRGISSAAEDHK